MNRPNTSKNVDPKEILLVQTTCPDVETARQLTGQLLEQRLATCINLVNNVESHYSWEGKRKQGTETLMLIKAPALKYQALEAAILKDHPYELPEIIAVSLNAGLPAYLNWVAAANEAATPGDS
jgi:periplasmic divalent cation tolerance protein